MLLRTACCQNRHGTAFFHSFIKTEIGSGRPSRARKTQQPTALGVRLGIFLCSPPFSEEIEGFKSTQMVNGQTKRGAGIQQRTAHQTHGLRAISSPLLSHTLVPQTCHLYYGHVYIRSPPTITEHHDTLTAPAFHTPCSMSKRHEHTTHC